MLELFFMLADLEPHVPLRRVLLMTELVLLLTMPPLLRVGCRWDVLQAVRPVLALVVCPASVGRRQLCAANPGSDFCSGLCSVVLPPRVRIAGVFPLKDNALHS